MKKKRVLVQWLGHNDLRALASSLPVRQQAELMALVKGEVAQPGNLGPVKTLVANEPFDEIRLLSTFPAVWNKKYANWLATRATIVPVKLENPTDYRAIFRIAEAELAAVRARRPAAEAELCLHLSPGTPAMAAVWLLLGKTRYPATFYETYGNKSWVTDVPFELTIDVIPDLLRNPDAHLQHLAAQSPSEIEGFADIAGDSRAIREVVGRAKRAAVRCVNTLLLGESGTGKEMFARAIHLASPRRNRPFVVINCAALSQTLLESELFGHTKGAFTGADRDRKGAFELADGGTLFLDEIGECSLETQAKLLRVLQPAPGDGPSRRVLRRLGDDRDRQVDVRIVAATNRDLHEAIASGEFREDLYYRLAALSITIPPLRERRSDIPAIAQRLLEQINRNFQAEEPAYEHKSISTAANAFVKKHRWPGNVRQLYNVLVQASVLAAGPVLEPADLVAALGEIPADSRPPILPKDVPIGEGFNLEEFLNELRRHYLRKAMVEAHGVKSRAARLLGFKNYQTLDAQLKRLNVAIPSDR